MDVSQNDRYLIHGLCCVLRKPPDTQQVQTGEMFMVL
jgi:hypothetical protein